jgi:hypothetical protein
MAVPYIGPLRAAGLAKETTLGTLKTPPDIFVPMIPPDSFYSAIPLLESQGIRFLPDIVYKVAQGPATLNAMKLKMEVEPEGGIGQFLKGTFGTDTLSNVGAAYTHKFTRQSTAQLQTYSWWFDKGAFFPQFVGCMIHKFDVVAKAGAWVECESEWVGLGYDSTGTSKTPSYSALQPFTFANVAVTVAGGSVLIYDNIKITIDNMVKADHLLKGSIYPGVIYSGGMKVNLQADIVFEDVTEYNKFLNGTTTSFTVTITSGQNIPTTATPYSLTFTLPNVFYSAAPIPIPKDLLKVSFSAVGVYNTGTTETLDVQLVNSVSSAY